MDKVEYIGPKWLRLRQFGIGYDAVIRIDHVAYIQRLHDRDGCIGDRLQVGMQDGGIILLDAGEEEKLYEAVLAQNPPPLEVLFGTAGRGGPA